jgi:hypothetical protein
MIFGALRKLIRAPSRARHQSRSTKVAYKPTVEGMEERLLLAVFTWSGAAGTAWSDPGNWQENGVPGATDTAVFDDTATQFASAVDAAATDTLAALIVTWSTPGAAITLEQHLGVGDLQMDGGAIDGTFELTIGSGEWTGGTVSTAKFIVSLDGLLTISGDDPKVLGAIFENHGTTRWTGGDVTNTAASTIVNNKPTGVFEVINHAQWLQQGDKTGFFNEGKFRKIDDAGTTTFDIAFYGLKTADVDIQVGTLNLTGNGKHVGPIHIAAGAKILCAEGYLLDGVTIIGEGLFHITGTDPVIVANGVKIDNLRLDSGELGYLGTIFVFDTFEWNGGTLVGRTEIKEDATMTIAGDAAKAVRFGAPIVNFGTTLWQDSSPIDLGGVWTNAAGALFEAQSGGLMFSLGSGAFVNEGVFRKSGGGKTTMQTQFTNTGLVEGFAGAIELYRGTSSAADNEFSIADGATVDLVDFTLDGATVVGDGQLRLTGAGVVSLKGNVHADNLEQTNGTILTNEGSLLVHERMTWVRGFITGVAPFQVEIAAEAELHIVGPDDRVLSGNIVSFGTTFWTGTGVVTITNGRSFTNKPGAVFEIQGSSALTSAGTLRNEGLVRRREPDGTTTRIDVTLVNTGIIQVLSGMISMGKAFTNTGWLVVAAQCTFSTDQVYTQGAGGSLTLRNGTLLGKNGVTIQAGSITGLGTIQGNVLSNGIISPRGSGKTGIIRIVGNFSQAGGGTVQIDIGGLSAGDGFDQLQVTGTVTLDGRLDVKLTNGFQPQAGAVFEVITFASQTGTFSTMTGDIGLFDVAYNTDDVTLITKSGRARPPRLSRLPVVLALPGSNRDDARHITRLGR